MMFKKLAIAAAVLVLASTGARAALTLTSANGGGNSSVAFVAIDNAGTISYAADLSVRMADFLPLLSGNTFAAGALSVPGTSAIFNLRNNTYTLNGSVQTFANAPAWSGNLTSFLNTAGSGSYQWGVVAGDGVTGVASATNAVRGQNLLFTSGTVVDYDTSNDSGTNAAAVNSGQGQVNEFFAASNSQAGNTHSAGRAGSNTATSGTAFLGTSMVNNGIGNFSQQFGNNNYLVNPGDQSYFSWVQNFAPPSTTFATLGATVGFGADPARPAVWTWNEVTGDLTYTVPVPEASTTFMLLAGLGAMGLVVRRRSPR